MVVKGIDILAKLININMGKNLKESCLLLVRNLSYPSAVCDKAGKIIGMNDAFTDLAGYSKEELEQQKIFRFLPKSMGEDIQNALKNINMQTSIIRKVNVGSGKEDKILDLTVTLFEEQGEVSGQLWIFSGVSEGRLGVQDFQSIEEESYASKKIPKVGTWTYDFAEEDFFVSKDTYQIFGRIPEEFDGSLENVISFIHLKDQESFYREMENAYQGRPLDIVLRIITSKGQEKKIHARAEMFYRKDHSPDTMIGTVQDLTIEPSIENSFYNLDQSLQQRMICDYQKLFDMDPTGDKVALEKGSKEIESLKRKMKKNYQKLQQDEETFRMGIWSMDLNTFKLSWSKVTFEIYGLDPEKEEPEFDDFVNMVHPEDQKLIFQAVENPPENQPFEVEFRIQQPNQNIRYVKHLIELVYEDETPIMIRGNIQDVTEQRELEELSKKNREELKNLQNRYQLMLSNSEEVLEIIDEEGQIKYINPAVKKMMGYSHEEIEGKYIWDFVEGSDKIQLKTLVEMSLEKPRKTLKGTVTTHTKDKQKLYLEVTMNNHLKNSEVQGIILNWRDVTAKVNLQRKVEHITNYDEATDFPNRAYFRQKLIGEIHRSRDCGKGFVVFMIGIQDFKRIGDALGMDIGDQLIKEIGRKIHKLFPNKDVFLSRYHENQFALLVPGMNGLAECQKLAEEIFELFSVPLLLGQYELDVNVNLGSSIYPEDGITEEELIKYSNTALNRGKEGEENQYQAYSSKMDIQSFKKFSLRNDFRRAIDQDELRIYFQPIINLQTGKILSVEALTRWEHPEWGLIPPDEFIPMAERTGLIIPMGKWVIDRVCRYYKHWMDQGYPEVKVSVNCSGIEFFRRDFVKDIQQTLEKYKLDPKFLTIEITESVLIVQRQQTEKDLKSLQSMGIKVAIDDFGTGYSSLTYLNMLEMDILKIDREFLQKIPRNENSKKILSAIINLAKDLKMTVVAEGIENWEQVLFLRRLSCTEGQGYLFSRPLPEEKIDTLLRKGFIHPSKSYDTETQIKKERRKYFRLEFPHYLEANLSILEIKGKKIKVCDTKVLIKYMGSGGLCFISDVNFPIKNDWILQFKTDLLGEDIQMEGTPVWRKDREDGTLLYGLKFIIDENLRMKIVRLLNKVRFRMKKDIAFNEGRFITTTIKDFFS